LPVDGSPTTNLKTTSVIHTWIGSKHEAGSDELHDVAFLPH
jgi:hypothetical protein